MATDEGNFWAARDAAQAIADLTDACGHLEAAIFRDTDALLHGAAKVALARVDEARSILATALADMERITRGKT